VKRGTESAHPVAAREMRQIVEEVRASRHDIAGCAVLTPSPMPGWTTAEILAVHFRMHKAEGVLFPDHCAARPRPVICVSSRFPKSSSMPSRMRLRCSENL